ncbi:lectin, mannose-binding 2-like a isoform X1 [Conger conger]|uniref:lectin, mannose-binding 2-like a isoform X1 n=1 Tax=Conger conger TaxID=82655 RepID=UPI002A5AAC5F|nr:lectin, mannose-binding 2-like a isoform X1 [Conger conger]
MAVNMYWVLISITIMTNACWGDDGHEMEEFLKREHSLTKPYQAIGSSMSSHWELMGDAMVTTEQVRLTPDMQSKQGAVWSRIPCNLKDWELQVHFKIHGEGKKNLNGDGLAVWYTKERMQKGPVFGNTDFFTGLGVFVDTYPNEEKHLEAQKRRYTPRAQRIFPYVLAMVGNGTLGYDHERDGRPTELGGCTAMVRNLKHDTFLFIRYVRRRLTMMIDIEGQHEWRDCLDIPGVKLPLGYYFGASAITGDLSDNHDMISLKLYELTVIRSKHEEEEEEEILIPSVDNLDLLKEDASEAGLSGVGLFFTVLFSLLGCLLLLVIGLVLYSHWSENSRKRFY